MSLFQQTIIEKYLQSVNRDKIHSAFQLFRSTFLNPAIQENIRNSKEEQYQEGFLHDLFVHVLGYTLNPAHNFNLTTEYKNVKDSKKADGVVLINGMVKVTCEIEKEFYYENNFYHYRHIIGSKLHGTAGSMSDPGKKEGTTAKHHLHHER